MLNYYAKMKRQAELKREILVESTIAKINESAALLTADEITLPEFFRLAHDLSEIYEDAKKDVDYAIEGLQKEAKKVGAFK